MNYKEIGISLYGSVVRGKSDKRIYEIQTRTTQRLFGVELSNPNIASWTKFIRTIKGECLHAIHSIGGRVVSFTPDFYNR